MARLGWTTVAPLLEGENVSPPVPPQQPSQSEGMVEHLVKCCRAFQIQLQALQTEHEALREETSALRTCLERNGVVRSSDVEREIQKGSFMRTRDNSFYAAHAPASNSAPLGEQGQLSQRRSDVPHTVFSDNRGTSAEAAASAAGAALSTPSTPPQSMRSSRHTIQAKQPHVQSQIGRAHV